MIRKSIANKILLPEVNRLVEQGHHVKIRVKGRSMIPFLYGDRDEVYLSPFQGDDLRPGSIVLAYLSKEDRYVLHRIRLRSGNKLVLMGDGNVKGTEVCLVSDVKARIGIVVRNGKKTDLSDKNWQKKAALWLALLPIRRYLLFFFRTKDEPGYFRNTIKRKFKNG